LITFNQTPGNDNNLIWLLEVFLDSGTLYFATQSITLDSVNFKAEIFYNTIGNVGSSLNLEMGANIGQYENFSFSIPKCYTTDLTDLFPYIGGALLDSRIVRLSCVWRGATTLSEVTVINKYEIYDWSLDQNKININCKVMNELSVLGLFWCTQKEDSTNLISYYPNCPDGSLGKPLPILYGDYNLKEPDLGTSPYHLRYPKPRLESFPVAICVDIEKNEFLVCGHKIKEYTKESHIRKTYGDYDFVDNLNYYLYHYIDNSNSYALLYISDIDGNESMVNFTNKLCYKSSIILSSYLDANIDINQGVRCHIIMPLTSFIETKAVGTLTTPTVTNKNIRDIITDYDYTDSYNLLNTGQAVGGVETYLTAKQDNPTSFADFDANTYTLCETIIKNNNPEPYPLDQIYIDGVVQSILGTSDVGGGWGLYSIRWTTTMIDWSEVNAKELTLKGYYSSPPIDITTNIEVYDLFYTVYRALCEGISRVKALKTVKRKRFPWEALITAGIGVATQNYPLMAMSVGQGISGMTEEVQKTVIENGSRVDGLDNLENQMPCSGMMYEDYIDE